MNKYDVAEIKKQIKMTSDELQIHNIALYYVDPDKNITSELKGFCPISDMDNGISPGDNDWNLREEESFVSIAKKILSGQLGKGVAEHEFIDEACEKFEQISGMQQSLLCNKKKIDEYIHDIVNKYSYIGDYAIMLMSCTFIPSAKDSKGRKTKDADLSLECDEMSFLIGALCEIKSMNIGLYINSDGKAVNDTASVKCIANPFTGFMYPAYNNHKPQEGSIIIYNKKPASPDEDFMSIMELDFDMPADEENTKITNLLKEVASDDYDTVSYNILQGVQEDVLEIVESQSMNSTIPHITSQKLKEIFINNGIEEKRLKNFEQSYKEKFGTLNYKIKAISIADGTKVSISSPDISITVNPDMIHKIKPKEINGETYLTVKVDETFEFNGIRSQLLPEPV